MSSTAAKVIAALAIFLTVVLAILGYRVSRQYAANSEAAQQQVKKEESTPKILAVVALRPLGAYQVIDKDAVALTEVGVAPKDYYTSLEDVVGKQPMVDVDQGAPLTKRYFNEGNALAKSIPLGFQAVSVEINDVVSVGGFVRPGDTVDVLMTLRNGSEIDNSQARVLLKNVRVLAYEEQLVDRPEGLKDDVTPDRNRRQQRTAVLAVRESETTRLMLGASLGELRLALHGMTDPATAMALLPGDPGAPAPVATAAAVSDTSGAAAPPGLTPGGLPVSAESAKADAAKQVPDKAITMRQLSRVEPPPAQRRTVVREKVYVYRASQVETITTQP